MLSATEDHYAAFIEPEAARSLTGAFSGTIGLVGVVTTLQDERIVVTGLTPGGAAVQAGLQVGDVILEIDGKVIDKTYNTSEVGLLLRGAPLTTVEVKIQRGDQVSSYKLVRQESQFVTSRMLPGNIGYISLSAFNEKAAGQMKQALGDLLAEQPVGLIWDLRNNEGGDMNAAQTILSFFLKDGLLFTAQLTGGRTVEFKALGNPLVKDLPLLVLMDKTSYSAAETCAAAISETGRGKTIGSTSYGKGVIQGSIPMPGNTLLQMTVAKWFSPSGTWYQGTGVSPQVGVIDDPATEVDEVLQKAIEILETDH
jgi:carboxyl-terminal processing protease